MSSIEAEAKQLFESHTGQKWENACKCLQREYKQIVRNDFGFGGPFGKYEDYNLKGN